MSYVDDLDDRDSADDLDGRNQVDGRDPVENLTEDEFESPEILQIDRLLREVWKPQPTRCEEKETLDPWVAAALPGRFEFKKMLGTGAFGLVLMVHDHHLNRDAALKVLRPEWMAYESARKRFLRESRAAARLNHTNIVRVLEADENDRIAWQLSDTVCGVNLAEHLSHGALPLRKAARFCKEIADAIDYAHQAGVAHRDIKPENILVSAQPGEGLKQARAYLTDFGLAKVADDTQQLSNSGAMVGTPRYMAPEQFNAEHKSFRPSADIYSLGTVLFECLTGQCPFQDSSTVAARANAGTRSAPSVREFNPSLPRDLEIICKKAMSPEPFDRYVSAGELASDLQNFLNGLPISARPLPLYEQGWRIVKSNRLLASMVGLILLSLTLLYAVSLRNRVVVENQNKLLEDTNAQLEDKTALATKHADDAQALRDAAIEEQKRYQALAWSHGLAGAYRSFDGRQLSETRRNLERLREVRADADKMLEWQLLDAELSSHFRPLMQIDGAIEEIRSMGDSSVIIAAENGHLYRYDLATGEINLDHDLGIGSLTALAVHPDGKQVIVNGIKEPHKLNSGPVFFDCEAMEVTRRQGWLSTTPESIAISSDGRYVLCGPRYKNPMLLDVQDRKWRPLPGEFTARQTWMAYSDCTDQFVCQSSSYSICLIRAGQNPSNTELSLADVFDGVYIKAATVLPGRPLVAVAGRRDMGLWVIDIRTGQIVYTLRRNNRSEVVNIIVHPESNLLVAGCEDGEIVFWDLSPQLKQTPMDVTPNKQNPESSVVDEQRLIAVFRDEKQETAVEALATYKVSESALASMVFVGSTLVCGSADGQLSAIAVQSTYGAHNGNEWSATWMDSTGGLLLRQDGDDFYQFDSQLLQSREESELPIRQVADENRVDGFRRVSEARLVEMFDQTALALPEIRPYSRAGPAEIITSSDGTCLAWTCLQSKIGIGILRAGDFSSITSATSTDSDEVMFTPIGVSADVCLVAVMANQYNLLIYELEPPHRIVAQFQLPGVGYHIDWHPDGTKFIVGGHFDSIVQCDLRQQTVDVVVQGVSDTDAIQYIDGGRQIVSGHSDGTVKFTSLASGTTETLSVHQGIVGSIVISADERIGVSADGESNISVWMIPSRERLGTLFRTAPSDARQYDVLWLSPDGSRFSAVVPTSDGPVVRTWHLSSPEVSRSQ